MANSEQEADRNIQIKVKHPFLFKVNSDTIKVDDKNDQAPPAYEIFFSLETSPAVRAVLEIEKAQDQYTLKLNSQAQGLLCVLGGELSYFNPDDTGLIVSTPEKILDLFSLSGSSDALLVADSESGWSLQEVGTCDSIS